MAKTNLERHHDAVRRRIERDHDYRVKIWAQCEIRILSRLADLQASGGQPPDLFTPDFSDSVMLHEYAAQKDGNATLTTE